MGKETLAKYLNKKRIQLNETLNELKDVKLSDNFTERVDRDIERAEAQLDVVMDVIRICANRGRF
jgi:hypothetical protein